jgi:hypothetical protein
VSSDTSKCQVQIDCRTRRPAATSAEGPKFGLGQHRSSDLLEALRLEQAPHRSSAGLDDAAEDK